MQSNKYIPGSNIANTFGWITGTSSAAAAPLATLTKSLELGVVAAVVAVGIAVVDKHTSNKE